MSVETRDRELLERVLRREQVWAVYGLGDLEEPHFARSRWLMSDPQGGATVLLYTMGEHTTVITYGEGDRAADLLREATLPARFDLHFPDRHSAALLPLLEGELVPHLRLALTASELRPVNQPGDAVCEQLTRADVPAALELYTHYPNNWFEPHRVDEGLYLGVRADGELVAVGGTHVVAPGMRVAALGDIVTAPAHRGRGMCSLLTHELCGRLFAAGIELVALNVAQVNVPAQRAYTRVGFGRTELHFEGHGLRLVSPPGR